MYAGNELPEELNTEMERAAFADPKLALDMAQMRHTVDAIRSLPSPEFTEESYQRILMKMYARGAQIQAQTPTPTHLQYQLPIQG